VLAPFIDPIEPLRLEPRPGLRMDHKPVGRLAERLRSKALGKLLFSGNGLAGLPAALGYLRRKFVAQALVSGESVVGLHA
jgi:hypothetical protein